jgi:hypothetical protein
MTISHKGNRYFAKLFQNCLKLNFIVCKDIHAIFFQFKPSYLSYPLIQDGFFVETANFIKNLGPRALTRDTIIQMKYFYIAYTNANLMLFCCLDPAPLG